MSDEPPTLADGKAVLARISASLPSLSQSDAAVARVIVSDPERVVEQSISEVADAAGTSASTVVRCSQRLGFSGFQELRLALVRELGAIGRTGIPRSRADGPQAALDNVLAMQVDSVRSIPATLDRAQFDGAVDTLSTAGKVVFAGIGANLGLVQDAGYACRNIGIPVEAPLDVHSQQTAATLLGAGDACVTVSQTGSSRDSIMTAKTARDAGAKTIAITGFLRSPLTEVSDYHLVAGDPTLAYELESIPSRLAMKAVLDALLVTVAMRNPQRTSAAWTRATAIQLRNVY
jgi:RpiR family transcriptional regulator, carbohydrate utilization regulator